MGPFHPSSFTHMREGTHLYIYIKVSIQKPGHRPLSNNANENICRLFQKTQAQELGHKLGFMHFTRKTQHHLTTSILNMKVIWHNLNASLEDAAIVSPRRQSLSQRTSNLNEHVYKFHAVPLKGVNGLQSPGFKGFIAARLSLFRQTKTHNSNSPDRESHPLQNSLNT